MSLIKWEPFGELERFFNEEGLPSSYSSIDLAVDVYEKGKDIIAEMNIPGMKKEDINVSVEDNMLIVSGKREEEKEDKDKNYYSKEIKRGYFERKISLPYKVEGSKAEAEYKDGVLKIKIPKKDGSERMKIAIK